MLATAATRLERLAQMRDVTLEHVRRRLRRRVAPEVVDQAVRRDDLVRVQEEKREHCPLLRAAERKEIPVCSDLQWA